MRRACPLLLVTVAAFAAACAGAPPPDRAATSAAPPNLVLFLVDDMGWMDSTVYGSRYYETPALERLARRGVVFSNAYAASPVCSPTRASLLTGKDPARLGFTMAWGHRAPIPAHLPFYRASAPPEQRHLLPRSETHLPAEEVTIAEALRAGGYRTGFVGKWHVGSAPEHGPASQGFEHAVRATPDAGPPSYFSPYGFAGGSLVDGPPGEYLTDRLTEEALAFLAVDDPRPFFLELAHFAVHAPWGHRPEITERFVGREDPRGEQGNPIMASMLCSVDRSLGRVLDRLDELGVADRTVVLVTSDNGGSVQAFDGADDEPEGSSERRLADDWLRWAGTRPPTSNAPLREGKAWLYEGGTRVPLVVAGPGVLQGGRSDALVSSPDFFPTLLALAGLGDGTGRAHDGFSFVPALRGETGADAPRREAVFAHFPHPLRLYERDPLRMAGSSVRRGDWKLIRWYEHADPVELFDLASDVGETRDLSEERPEVRRELELLLDEHLAATGARLPLPNPARDS